MRGCGGTRQPRTCSVVPSVRSSLRSCLQPSETCPGPSEREGGTGSKRRGCPELGFPFSPVSKPDALPVLHAQPQLARKSLSTRGANACVRDSGTEIPQWLFHTLILQAHSRPQKRTAAESRSARAKAEAATKGRDKVATKILSARGFRGCVPLRGPRQLAGLDARTEDSATAQCHILSPPSWAFGPSPAQGESSSMAGSPQESCHQGQEQLEMPSSSSERAEGILALRGACQPHGFERERV